MTPATSRRIIDVHITDGGKTVETISVVGIYNDTFFQVSSKRLDGAETLLPADYKTTDLHGAMSNALGRAGFDVPAIAERYDTGVDPGAF